LAGIAPEERQILVASIIRKVVIVAVVLAIVGVIVDRVRSGGDETA
jgi:hypothetical protein